MQIFDIRILEGVPFEDYLALPGISYSAVKETRNNAPLTDEQPTAKMRFGSLVDAYVFEPETYTGEMYNMVRPAAQKVNEVLGPLIKRGRRQLAVMCTMVHNGLYIYYKGRIDLAADNLVIDLKISDVPILRAIEIFGYNHQLNGYAIPLKAKGSLLFSVTPTAPFSVQLQMISNSTTWWEKVVLKHGKPC